MTAALAIGCVLATTKPQPDGSTRGVCARCGRGVWVGRRSRAFRTKRPLGSTELVCLECLDALLDDEQEDEAR